MTAEVAQCSWCLEERPVFAKHGGMLALPLCEECAERNERAVILTKNAHKVLDAKCKAV